MRRTYNPSDCSNVLRLTGIRLFMLALIHAPLLARESLEIGFERYQPVAPQANANFTGVLINYHFDRNFYVGTSQSALYLRGDSDYRPDLHIGAIFPLWEFLSLEATLGVDFYTGLIIALAIADEDSEIDYKFATNFYSPYFNLTTGVRFDLDWFALKVMAQTQFGGYLQSDTSAFNASLWLGLGATVRIAM